MVLEVTLPVFPHDDIGKAEEHKSLSVSVVAGEDPSLGECKGC